jgi:hypothetical protein
MPETGPFRAVWRRFNQLRDYVQSIRPARSANMTFHQSTKGTSWKAQPKGETTTGGAPVWLS